MREKEIFWSSYQFLQVLDEKVDIDNLTKDTISYFENVSSLNANEALIYLLGEDADFEKLNMTTINNPMIKVLGMNKKAIRDPHITKSIIKTLNRKIRESYCGKLIIHGHYEFFVADPMALLQHALEPNMNKGNLGYLKEGESFSQISLWSSIFFGATFLS